MILDTSKPIDERNSSASSSPSMPYGSPVMPSGVVQTSDTALPWTMSSIIPQTTYPGSFHHQHLQPTTHQTQQFDNIPVCSSDTLFGSTPNDNNSVLGAISSTGVTSLNQQSSLWNSAPVPSRFIPSTNRSTNSSFWQFNVAPPPSLPSSSSSVYGVQNFNDSDERLNIPSTTCSQVNRDNGGFVNASYHNNFGLFGSRYPSDIYQFNYGDFSTSSLGLSNAADAIVSNRADGLFDKTSPSQDVSTRSMEALYEMSPNMKASKHDRTDNDADMFAASVCDTHSIRASAQQSTLSHAQKLYNAQCTPWAKTIRSATKEGKTRTADKYRQVYTDHQRLELEKEYLCNQYINIKRKQEIGQELHLTERQIKIWFQNRRAKERRLEKRTPNTKKEFPLGLTVNGELENAKA